MWTLKCDALPVDGVCAGQKELGNEEARLSPSSVVHTRGRTARSWLVISEQLVDDFDPAAPHVPSPSLKLSHWYMTDDDARAWHHEYIIGSNRMPDPIYGRRGCVAVSRGTALGSPPLNCPVLRPLCHSRLSATVARGGGAETAAPAPGPWWPPSGRVLCHSPASCHDPGRAAGSVWRGPASAAVTASGVRPGGPGPRRHGPGPVTVSAWDSKFPPPQSSPGQQQRLIMISSCPAMIACRNSWAVCAIIHD